MARYNRIVGGLLLGVLLYSIIFLSTFSPNNPTQPLEHPSQHSFKSSNFIHVRKYV